MFQKIVLAASLIILVLACGTSKKAVQEPVPAWVNSRPITDLYYIGIAKVSKKIHPTDFQQTAKKLALNDLASEISVKIESNSLLSTYEDNSSFNSDYQQYVKTETSKDLSGYEMVNSYETKDLYQVYYRLSKSKWTQIQAQRKADAARKAYNWYTQAKSEKEQLNYTVAIQYYLNGLLDIKKYWSESVVYQDANQSVAIDKQLKTELLGLLSDIQLEIKTKTILLNAANSFRQSVKVSVLNSKNEFIKDIPVTISYKKSSMPYRASLFSLGEPLEIPVEDVDFGWKQTTFKAEINKAKVLKIGSENKKMLGFLTDAFNVKPAISQIKIEMPKMYLSTNIQENLTNDYIHYLKDGIKASLNKKNIQIVSNLEDADLELTITPHEIKGPDRQKFKYVYLSYNIEIKNVKRSKLVYTESYPKIKGADISFEKATEKAYSKAADEFQYQYAKALIKGILK